MRLVVGMFGNIAQLVAGIARYCVCALQRGLEEWAVLCSLLLLPLEHHQIVLDLQLLLADRTMRAVRVELLQEQGVVVHDAAGI